MCITIAVINGNTWTQVSHINNEDLTDLEFIDENIAFIKAKNKIRKSTDGGLNWTDLTTPPPQNQICSFL